MESRNPFKEVVRSLQEENKNLSEELNHLKYKIIYYENRCNFLKSIINKLLVLRNKFLN
jgi:predicted RNase H-like nuclease (RuvC/YqgF family)